MEKRIKKVRKTLIFKGSRHAVKRGRMHRFAKWAKQEYGISFMTVYEKLRRHRIKPWEGAGIIRCMHEFGFHGRPDDLWGKCVKNKLYDFMKTKGMCRVVVKERFSSNNFSELEMKGYSDTYRNWRENIDLKKK